MSIGINADFNFSEFMKITKNIDAVFAKKIEVAAEIFVNEGRLMLDEFRKTQYSAEHIPPPKGSKKGKLSADKNKEMMADALDYAEAHSGDSEKTDRGSPWINRTFRAARGVHCYVEKNPESLAVGLYHAMAYGAYLEFAYNRKYAVVEPLIRQHSPKIHEKIKLLFVGD